MPSRSVSIRAIEIEKYKVIDKQKNELLEEIEESRAFFQVDKLWVFMGIIIWMLYSFLFFWTLLCWANKFSCCRSMQLRWSANNLSDLSGLRWWRVYASRENLSGEGVRYINQNCFVPSGWLELLHKESWLHRCSCHWWWNCMWAPRFFVLTTLLLVVWATPHSKLHSPLQRNVHVIAGYGRWYCLWFLK